MKELVYRDILGQNPRKREVSIEETSSGLSCDKVTKKWICKYFLKEKFSSTSLSNLREWVQKKRQENCRKDCHIMREVNSKTRLNQIICKVLGDLFVISGDTAYRIVYINEVKIQINARSVYKRGV